MPLGCFGPSSGEKQLRVQLDQAIAQLSAKDREIADLKRRHEETATRQAQVQRAASDDLVRSANVLRQQVQELSSALQAKEREAAEASKKLQAALDEAADAKRQLEEGRVVARSADQAQAAAATAQTQIAEYKKQLREIQTLQEALTQELAAARKDAAVASSDASHAHEDAASARDQLAKVLADQSKAIAEAEERAAAIAQEAAASTVAAAADMAEKAAVANRQQAEALKAELAAQMIKLEAAERAAAELPALRQQVQEEQNQLASALAELASFKELRRDLSERLAEYKAELEDASLFRQSTTAERQVLLEQLEQVTAERIRLETQVQELEANLLEAVTAATMAASAAPEAAMAVTAAAADVIHKEDSAKMAAISRPVGCSGGGVEDDLARLEALGAKALAVELAAVQREAYDLRKELERTIVGHAEEEEAVETENEKLKGLVEELTAALAAAESRISELEIMQASKDKFSTQLCTTQNELEAARNRVEELKLEIVGLELERAALRNREDEAQAEVAKLQQQLKEAQMRAVELVSANADLQVEQAKLRSEVLSQGLMSDTNTQMTTKLLTDYQALKAEHGRLRGELRRKDEMMALLQEQLSSLTEIDLDSMLRQIDNVQTRKPSKKSVPAAPVEVMMAAAGLSAKLGLVSAGSGSGAVGTPVAARSAGPASASVNGADTPTAVGTVVPHSFGTSDI